MKPIGKYQWQENILLYYSLKNKAKEGNKQAGILAKKLEPKYRTKKMLLKYEMLQYVILDQQSSRGNFTAWQKLDKIRRLKKEWEYWEYAVKIIGLSLAKSTFRKRKTPVKPKLC